MRGPAAGPVRLMPTSSDPAWSSAPLALIEAPLIPRPWGGLRLAELKGEPASAERMGESFEAACDPTDGEAAAHPSTVAHPNGNRAALPALLAAQDVAMLGAEVVAQEGPRLPLLPKFLDVAGLLSVQAHPPGNPELYVVLEAGPKAALYLGFKETLDPAPWLARWQDGLKKLPALQAAAGDFDAFNRWSLGKDSASLASLPEALRADAESLRQLNRDTLEIMNRLPLKAGEVLFNAQEDAAGRLSAAVHALGTAHGDAGQALILEIRRPGVTFRAWDHGRLPQRNVDPATALAASPLQASCPDDFKVTIRPGPTACLARCEAFTAWRLAPEDGAPLQRDTQERVRTLHVLEGTALIESAGGALRLRRGQSALLPARLGSWTLTGPAVAVEAAPGAVP